MSTVSGSKSRSSVSRTSSNRGGTSKTSTSRQSQSTGSKSAVRNAQPAARSKDHVKLSQDAGVQAGPSQVPNFGSWAQPAKPGGATPLKELSGDTLARRDKGGRVKELQSHLNQAGAKLEVDGKFGPLTQKAVKKFQKQHGLTVDGKVGPETMAALNKGLQPKSQPEAKPQTQPEAKPQPQPEAKPQPQPEAKPKPQPEAKPQPQPEAKPQPQPEVKPQPQPEVKPQPQPEAKPQPQPEAKPQPQPEAKPQPQPEVKPQPQPEAKPQPAPIKKAEGLPQLADKKMTPEEKYNHYAAMVKAAGGKIDEKNPTVLGLRGLGLDGARHDSGKNTGSGDDTFVILGRDKKGNPTVTELPGSTHAAVKQGSVAGGVAQLRPGNYEATRRHDYKGREAWALNGGGNVPVYRDRNRDGMISEAEKAHAVANNTKGDGILFHRDRGVSIGCQVLSDQVLGQLTKAVGGGNFHYTLIDANRPQ